jgi:hypothetical protein
MDAGWIVLVAELMKGSISLYLATLRLSGKTEAEIDAEFTVQLAKAINFKPSDIKDV